jgi:hypothetical protein
MARKATKRKTPPVIQPLDGPTPEQIRKGGVEREDFIHADLGQRVTAYVNRGGTPLARWKPHLTDTQWAAIQHCIRLWDITDSSPRLTASYGERIGGSSAEGNANRVIDAREDLWRIIDYFPGPLRTYWQVFENIARFDMPAGVAGSALSESNRTNEARANQVLRFVADYIAMRERL